MTFLGLQTAGTCRTGEVCVACVIVMFSGGTQMLVDDIGDVTVTNDGASILKLLEVEHPAAKVCLFYSPFHALSPPHALTAHPS